MRLRLCRFEDVPVEGGLRVCLDGLEPLAVFRCDGEVHVVEDTCPHAGASLAEGWVEDRRVACPAHGGEFCLLTGAALSFPAEDPIRAFAAEVVNGEVFAELTEKPEARGAQDDVHA
ncbi:Rieske (2Fe-2S) protein [Steroidobacter agaridevorans]|uniref:Rieske (2Fe-2S) protein n=1 Tax=Steroidobacter agaridevorans TaxID=2695856 RepID=UPI001379BFA4|nr:non-heme iron oxygenase ferredoxin subunit [Steroidobacter agaridevorans]